MSWVQIVGVTLILIGIALVMISIDGCAARHTVARPETQGAGKPLVYVRPLAN